jgi:copper chaperone CopZ
MGVEGVADVRIDLGARRAVVTHQGVDVRAMQAAVDEAGYEAEPEA